MPQLKLAKYPDLARLLYNKGGRFYYAKKFKKIKRNRTLAF